MKMVSLLLMVFMLTFATSACAQNQTYPAVVNQDNFETRVIRVSGYGAVIPNIHQTQAQLKLHAMRASRLDAYRNLAESVYGINLEGSSTVRDMAARHDQILAHINARIAGARVMDVILVDDDIYETILELTVDRHFHSCITQPQTCMAPVDAQVGNPAGLASTQQPNWQHCTGPDCDYGPGGYNAPYHYYPR
ncbi:hypothetical protein CKO35_12635 [Ectothiorhodospira shaposhnikovii]|uniref:LPP20 family lipoprotein n=1 Tax=Ectothiorhodospira shaposhnikovii TaxID=1054 RepID=UPI001903A2D1|nr:hypothetical protein [Ectothiorhodospira shaposhnikovii]MBK1674133.1 hypothetical protein [Ectothiorhodospira shaposhnikovii]